MICMEVHSQGFQRQRQFPQFRELQFQERLWRRRRQEWCPWCHRGGGILFPVAPLTLPSVPSMEEIAQSRPKRRNVKISTDPQSVAARHRRERISDRVRVLQHFVPGGTKMDTASMLDEAIHYVKFLQQQLQKLERLGNSYDARFMDGTGAGMMMPQTNNTSAMHPFDLNYCTYPTNMMQQSHQQHQHQQAQNGNNTTQWSSLCSRCFPDEQFCH